MTFDGAQFSSSYFLHLRPDAVMVFFFVFTLDGSIEVTMLNNIEACSPLLLQNLFVQFESYCVRQWHRWIKKQFRASVQPTFSCETIHRNLRGCDCEFRARTRQRRASKSKFWFSRAPYSTGATDRSYYNAPCALWQRVSGSVSPHHKGDDESSSFDARVFREFAKPVLLYIWWITGAAARAVWLEELSFDSLRGGGGQWKFREDRACGGCFCYAPRFRCRAAFFSRSVFRSSDSARVCGHASEGRDESSFEKCRVMCVTGRAISISSCV